ncbi:hypothetical protein SGLAM104S_07734 [Streptomyces glaucescens]
MENGDLPLPALDELRAAMTPPELPHPVLKSLLGAWALAACSPEETAAVEDHLGSCGSCADEARRLREAVGLLQRPDSLDLDPSLRTRVVESCLDRRPPRIPVPEWAGAYDAETARLDALLQDFGDAEWHAPVRLRWYDGKEPASRRTTIAGVIAHLLAVDGLVAFALGLDDPLAGLAGPAHPGGAHGGVLAGLPLPAHPVRARALAGAEPRHRADRRLHRRRGPYAGVLHRLLPAAARRHDRPGLRVLGARRWTSRTPWTIPTTRRPGDTCTA